MIPDLVYILVTMVFFGLCLVFAGACGRF